MMDVKSIVSPLLTRPTAASGSSPNVDHSPSVSFGCAGRQPGFACLCGSEHEHYSQSEADRQCVVGHRMVPTGPPDDLSAWRQAWHAAHPFAIGGVW